MICYYNRVVSAITNCNEKDCIMDSRSRREFSLLLYASLAAVLAVFVLNILGGMLRVSQTGFACPDWPTCFGAWGLPSVGAAASSDLTLSLAHRAVTIIAGLFVLAGACLAFRWFKKDRLLAYPMYLAALAYSFQVLLGGGVTLLGHAGQLSWLNILHSFLSLFIQVLLIIPLVVAFYRLSEQASGQSFEFRSPFANLSLVFACLVVMVWISGSLVSYFHAAQACSGWPLCWPGSALGWLSFAHRIAVSLASMAAAAWLWRAWLTQRSQVAILVATTATFVMFVAQALLGVILKPGSPTYLLALHQATAIAVWAVTGAQLTILGLTRRRIEDEALDRASLAGRQPLALLKDLLMLTKPIVVLLLLVTTFAGMVIGARQWPSPALAFWTLFGGFLAAGGSGAINQYIDRFDDLKMQRTQKRPIPSGRLTPAEGLAFGTAMLLVSFYLTVAFVNLLAALLCLAGMVYYVLIYSIFLKKTTVQNIVIGGGAGAIPPLVGWAAATGSLNIPSLFLFALVFVWTPPHFWALALVRAKDYARAGVPMLPVVRGEQETRWQILIYTIELVILTLLLPVFGLGGGIYLIGAAVLGLWLFGAAWQVWKEGGNKRAWKMYRYSSMYLAFIFFVLMIDRLVK